MHQQLAAWLTAQGIETQQGVSMADHTTLRVGGPAALWLEARGPADIALARQKAQAMGVPVQIIGLGSNLLVRDGGLPGLTIRVGPQMAAIRVEGNTIHAQAGARLSHVAQAAQAAGLSGMEALAGIPGAVGGAITMNAGAYGAEMGALAETVQVLDGESILQTLAQADMAFGYRHSVLMDRPGLVVTEATLRLTPGEPQAILEKMQGYARARREKQPLSLPSAGSFFKRPPGHFAGALIEQAGLKGASVGGAQVSALHAGFLVNTGGATASDFINLAQLVQGTVYKDSGVSLQTEVQIIGCDSSC